MDDREDRGDRRARRTRADPTEGRWALAPAIRRYGPCVACWGLLAVTAVAAISLVAGPARAHAFLVDSDPPHGARLDAPPTRIALQATEPIAEVVRFDLRGRDGRPVAIPPPRLTDGGQVAVVDTPTDLPPDVYTVSWHVVSAVDGHESSGEFAFAAGAGAVGELAAEERGAAAIPWWGVVASWLFFAGLASAGGALLAEHLFGARRVPLGPRLLARLGLLAATGAVLLRAGAATATPQGSLLTAGVALLAAAAVAAGLTATVWPALLLAGGAAGVWASHGHAAAAAGVLGAVVDLAHLLAGSLWAGVLVLAVAIWLRTSPTDRTLLLGPMRQYARLAIVLVVILATAGAVSALQLLGGWRDVWATTYGRVIVVKTGAFAVALGLAAAARPRLHAAVPSVRPRIITAEATSVVVAVTAAAMLVNIAPPVPSAPAEALLGPPPIEGPVARDAGLAGQLTVGVAAGDGRLDVLVFAPSGGLPGTHADLTARLPDGRELDLRPRGCGAGCFTQELPLPAGVTELTVDAEAPGWVGGTYHATLWWPARESRPELLDRTVAVMRGVDRLYLQEVTSSGPGSPPARFPDPPAPGEAPAGATLTGDQLMDLDPYGRGRVADVRPLPGDEPGLAFYLPGSRIFGTLWLDELGRIRRARLVTPGHEILRTFTYPGSP
ncbi:MAG: copper resistance protein CopC [Nitriliruptorales bacterium]